MESLPTVWFVFIAVLWFGYLFLECFDMGVGMHLFGIARDARDRRVLINTIGPVWDGNEVWLITAGAAIFAAFPFWYASLVSALYLPIVLMLLALIVRAVAIEWRSKLASPRWTFMWDVGIATGSLIASFCVGAMLAATTTGLPLNENGDRVGGPLAWLTLPAVVGGLALVCFSLLHGAFFLALKSEGAVRERANRFAQRWAVPLVLPLVAWVLIVQWQSGSPLTYALVALAVVALAASWARSRAGREGQAFAYLGAFLLAGTASIFAAVHPVLLPSTIDPAFDLTVWNAASGTYTLTVMTWVTAFGLPGVLAAQGWSYWIFRRRLGVRHMPEPHDVVPAVRGAATDTHDA
ncbi:cytochrome d ubiquinol oxidase subunit II [Gulosibacter sp. 10]|uniref:cytochrome d ubiquinol oxidase subunit II n=1 Tax=Gulosibacter sp. 10 TaxID=1255570 RepID=UPI00097EA260|nr:cytochrome d ubiquinol oxidase subunit II [Gulosibacter sp. 10]SJM70525.1 Cytochrome d ubiquinol oxidase subunit II [Gulosibacter sp. 10]